MVLHMTAWVSRSFHSWYKTRKKKVPKTQKLKRSSNKWDTDLSYRLLLRDIGQTPSEDMNSHPEASDPIRGWEVFSVSERRRIRINHRLSVHLGRHWSLHRRPPKLLVCTCEEETRSSGPTSRAPRLPRESAPFLLAEPSSKVIEFRMNPLRRKHCQAKGKKVDARGGKQSESERQVTAPSGWASL